MLKKIITLFKLGRKIAKSDILKTIFIDMGGWINFDTIINASDFASFLPNLNKVIIFFIIKFSILNE